MNEVSVAVVGATGAVGAEFLTVLAERDFPISKLRLLASPRSEGKTLTYRGKDYTVENLETADPSGIDIALFSAGGGISKAHAARFVEAGAVVVDNSSAFRMDPDVPLVIPEVNPEDTLKRPRGIVANPNCSTIIALVPLWPLHKKAGLKRAVICTYQAVSGAGAKAILELEMQSADYLEGRPVTPTVFPHQIAFNLFSHNSALDDEGCNEEEMKMIRETKKIFHDDKIAVSVTCVRVPTFRSHAEAIHAEFENEITLEDAREILKNAEGVRIVDDVAGNIFPMPMTSAGQDLVEVGRIRYDRSIKNGIAMFVAGDQLRKGAATNAVQVAELIVKEKE